jgi:amino acid transporter
MGMTGFRVVIAVVMVSFLSCLLSLQAAASRLLFSFARDGMIFGSATLKRLSPRTRVPVPALIVTGVIPAVIAGLGYWLQDAINTIISSAAIGIYVSFQMVVLGALMARARGWRPAGKFNLGRWGWAINAAAFAYGAGAVLNMLWPRAPQAPWYVDYAMLLTVAVTAAAGAVYMWVGKPHHAVAKTR